MVQGLDITDEDLGVFFEAKDLVKDMENPDQLATVVADEGQHWVARNDAAEKLIKMWEEGEKNRTTLHHLAYVGDHADEPYRSQANAIICNHL